MEPAGTPFQWILRREAFATKIRRGAWYLAIIIIRKVVPLISFYCESENRRGFPPPSSRQPFGGWWPSIIFEMFQKAFGVWHSYVVKVMGWGN